MAMRTLSQTIKALEARIENPSYGDLDCDILDYLQELDKLKKRSFTVPSLPVQKVTNMEMKNMKLCINCKHCFLDKGFNHMYQLRCDRNDQRVMTEYFCCDFHEARTEEGRCDNE